MKPAVVADIGNTRIKWGWCTAGVVTEAASLADDPAEWERQLGHWGVSPGEPWAVAGVHPARRDRLAAWLRERGHLVRVIERPHELPLRTTLEHPERAGIDRLLDAVAANSRRRPNTPAVIVDAGSAVTIDWLDAQGAFVGGAILPGLGLMARALHEHTALLPVIEPPRRPPAIPGTTTVAAIELGIFWAVAGAARALCAQYAERSGGSLDVFLTGGDGAALFDAIGPDVQFWPTMTLEGIRLTAEQLA
jgi:type III pantothenate kinase